MSVQRVILTTCDKCQKKWGRDDEGYMQITIAALSNKKIVYDICVPCWREMDLGSGRLVDG